MSRLLVKIKRERWLKGPRPPYLEMGDVPGDCLQDLRINENKLSVWSIEPDDSNLKRVMTALAGTHEMITTFYFLVFDETVVANLGLKMTPTNGNTADRDANRWHRDIVELSAKKALLLVIAIFDEARRVPFFQSDVEMSLQNAISAGHIDPNKLNSRLASKLTTVLNPAQKANTPSVSESGTNVPTLSVGTTTAKKSSPPAAKKKDKPQGFMKMCIEIASFSRAAWRRYRNNKSSQNKSS
ncbi:MAG: hypothetical protein LAO76_22200 [Acidobacteriia bacterium]|nr:hypothetical protein [Terriglobia bacterium]